MSIFKNFTIGKRLGFGFAVIISLSILIAIIGIWRLQTVADATHDMMQQPLAKERLIGDWYSKIDSGIRRTTAIAKSSDPSLGPYFAEEAAASAKHSNERQKLIEPLLSTDEEKHLFQKIMGQRKIYLSSRDDIAKLKTAGQVGEADRIFQTTFIPNSSTYQKLVHELLDMQQKKLDAIAQEIDATAEKSRNLLAVLAILVVTFGILCAWWLTTGITRPLLRAVEAARRVADGDLTGEIVVHSADEVGQLLQTLRDMNHSLLNIVTEVRNGTDTIATASREIASGNLDLSSRTEQQASSLEETASSMEELTSTVNQNADNARQANQLALSASEIAVKGGAVVSQVIDTMGSITDSSKKIVDIISVIDSIAFQTNILALNAAVEAARAGEHGRGFAVVASEVRNLAQRSAAAAKEIKALIENSVEKVGVGTKLVDKAGATMDEIVESVKRVTDIMGEITVASQEQTSGIEQINQAISQMDQATQQNAALVEEAAAAAASLQDQAANLSQVVSVFELDGANTSAVVTRRFEARKGATAIKLAGKERPSRMVHSASMRGSAPARRSSVVSLAAIGTEWEEF